MPTDPAELTIPEAVRRYRLNPHYASKLRALARAGRLPARHVGRDWLLQRAALDAWLAEQHPGRSRSTEET